MQKSSGDAVWFIYKKEVDLVTLGEYGGIRLYFRAGIGDPPKDIKRAQSIHLDLAVGDPVIPSPVKTHTHSILGDDSLSWCVYTIESSVAEKLHTLIVRHSDNSRSKDVFDLYYLMPIMPKCNHEILKQALSATFKSRGDPLPSDIPQVLNKIDKDLLQRGWKSAIAGLRERLDFDTIFEHVIKQCKNIFIG
ncbi:MAG: nucleotidyl transferase AbiEii/AbiGii toxin family protein [bacterium]